MLVNTDKEDVILNSIDMNTHKMEIEEYCMNYYWCMHSNPYKMHKDSITMW